MKAKIMLNDRIIGGQFNSLTVDGLNEMQFEGQINNYIKLNGKLQLSPDYKFILKSDLPDLSRLHLTGHFNQVSDDTSFKFEYNEEQRLLINIKPTAAHVSVRDIFYPISISISSGFSEETFATFKSEICWNTGNCEEETESIEIIALKNIITELPSISVKVSWRNKHTSLFTFENGLSSTNLKYLENDAVVLNIQSVAKHTFNTGRKFCKLIDILCETSIKHSLISNGFSLKKNYFWFVTSLNNK